MYGTLPKDYFCLHSNHNTILKCSLHLQDCGIVLLSAQGIQQQQQKSIHVNESLQTRNKILPKKLVMQFLKRVE